MIERTASMEDTSLPLLKEKRVTLVSKEKKPTLVEKLKQCRQNGFDSPHRRLLNAGTLLSF